MLPTQQIFRKPIPFGWLMFSSERTPEDKGPFQSEDYASFALFLKYLNSHILFIYTHFFTRVTIVENFCVYNLIPLKFFMRLIFMG